MAERKATNKYYPPDYDPAKGGLNKFQGTHALRERARKLHLGILIIRFEMPYNIWCDGCQNHIGMGVRYNAEKTKVGMYYSTPVYQFKMKCHLCPNYIEMKTDPGNLDYIIVSGARRQERRWDPTTNGQVVPEDKNVSKQLSTDPMFKLAHVTDDKSKSKNVIPTISLLEDLQGRWKDDYMANRLLRDQFRGRKREIKASEDRDNAILKKCSLDIPLLKESEDDKHIASLIRLQPSKSSEDRHKEKLNEIEKRSQFPISSDHTSSNNVQKIRNSLGISLGVKNPSTSHASICSKDSSNSSILSHQTNENSADKCNHISSISSSSQSLSFNNYDKSNSLLLISSGYDSSSSGASE